MDALLAWDHRLFLIVHQWSMQGSLLNPIMVIFAKYAEYLFYLAILFYWFKAGANNRRMVLQALLSASIALGVNSLLGLLFYRSRPFVTYHLLPLINHDPNASFPSDHATGAFVIAFTIWLFHKKERSIWMWLAAVVSVSRVWVGVHYPLDVLAGAGIAVSCAFGVHLLFSRWIKADTILGKVQGVLEKVERALLGKRISHLQGGAYDK